VAVAACGGFASAATIRFRQAMPERNDGRAAKASISPGTWTFGGVKLRSLGRLTPGPTPWHSTRPVRDLRSREPSSGHTWGWIVPMHLRTLRSVPNNSGRKYLPSPNSGSRPASIQGSNCVRRKALSPMPASI
jgi:hypothetical protein